MKVILMSGIPGSGKSTIVNRMVQDQIGSRTVTVCSADHFFMDESGEYKFDPSKLGSAHASCLHQFVMALTKWERGDADLDLLIVDNTNTSATELAPYVALAAAFGVECEIRTVVCNPEVAYARNVHGVPLGGIKRMAEVIATRQIPPFWNVKFTTINN